MILIWLILIICININEPRTQKKYLVLKNNTPLIIHISGPFGAGKTTLGDGLKEKFGDEIVVKKY